MHEQTKQETILKYRASMAIFKRWMEEGVITGQDLTALGTALAEKHGLSSRSIFLENDLLCIETRANIHEKSEDSL